MARLSCLFLALLLQVAPLAAEEDIYVTMIGEVAGCHALYAYVDACNTDEKVVTGISGTDNAQAREASRQLFESVATSLYASRSGLGDDDSYAAINARRTLDDAYDALDSAHDCSDKAIKGLVKSKGALCSGILGSPEGYIAARTGNALE